MAVTWKKKPIHFKIRFKTLKKVISVQKSIYNAPDINEKSLNNLLYDESKIISRKM